MGGGEGRRGEGEEGEGEAAKLVSFVIVALAKPVTISLVRTCSLLPRPARWPTGSIVLWRFPMFFERTVPMLCAADGHRWTEGKGKKKKWRASTVAEVTLRLCDFVTLCLFADPLFRW